ncbi:MAG: cyanoexosortase B [Spirulina sp. SIO3F2]|nr:cyanoexosortase B [Spirulina sp. SIO3F2]
MTSTAPSPSWLQRHWFSTVLGVILLLLYGPVLLHWIDGWLNKSISIEHEYFSHGLLGIPYAGYLVWRQRRKWQRLPDTAHPAGWVCLVIGALFYLSGTSEGVNLSLPLVLVGLCLVLKGASGLQLQRFPLLFVALATPNALPYLITPFTLPLQAFIANVAGFVLFQLGVPDLAIEGIYITVQDRLVEVAPYCAGLKMLFTSLYVAVLLLHWTGVARSRFKVGALLTGTVVISVAVNIVRNTILTYLHGMGYDGAFAWTHEGLGGDLISLGMLLLVVLWLDLLERSSHYYYGEPMVGIINYAGWAQIFGQGEKKQ